jgi:hypothetical protein
MAPVQCVACGYSLIGLPMRGRCPECGTEYDRACPGSYVPRPPFGRLLLLVPPLLVPLGLTLGYVVIFEGGCALMFATAILCLVLSILIAWRLADWRYGVELFHATDKRAFPTREDFVSSRRALYVLVQLGGCVGSVLATRELAAWLASVGVLPGGWS